MSTQFEGIVPGTYVIDPSHSEVGFTVRHLVGKVRGQFREFEGTLIVAEQPLDSSVSATIELSSVDTRNNDRDNHLRSGDFFSVESTPKMTFRSTGLKQDGDKLVATGDLTIREVTNPVELELEYLGTGGDPWGGTRDRLRGSHHDQPQGVGRRLQPAFGRRVRRHRRQDHCRASCRGRPAEA